MAKDIGPGMCVVCITEMTHNYGDCHPDFRQVTPNAIYFVEEVFDHPIAYCPHDNCGSIGLILKDRSPWIYCPNIFKPLDDGDTSLVKAEKKQEVLTPTYAPEWFEDADEEEEEDVYV